MITGKRRRAIYLNGNSYGLSLKGMRENSSIGNILSQDYLDFKLQVIKNYIEPLMNKKYEYLRYNYHMIDETLERIKKYSNEQNKHDIELFTKILKVIRNTVDIHLSFTETEKKLYGTSGVTQLLVRTSRIVLDAKYEIYNNLFGKAGLVDGVRNYDDSLIDRIDYLLKTISEPTFANIRYEMRDKVDLFLSVQKIELEKLISS